MGHYTAILTSSPEFIAKPIGRLLGVDAVYGSEYATDHSGLFSQILQVIQGEDKARITKQVCASFNLHRDEATAYSDSILDLAFLQSVGVPVVVNPDRRLKDWSIERNWKII